MGDSAKGSSKQTPPGGVPEKTGVPGKTGAPKVDAGDLVAHTRLAFQRLLKSDLQVTHATEEERKLLVMARKPVAAPLAQDYAAWRRSLLWIAGVTLVIVALFQFATFDSAEDQIRGAEEAMVERMKEQGDPRWQEVARAMGQRVDQTLGALGKDNLETIDGIFSFLIVPVLVGGILALLAAWKWTDTRLSRRLARIGWLIMFLTPFALAVMPVKSMLEFGHLQQAAEQESIAAMLGLQVGMQFFLLIGPRAIALFPGIIRSSMALKTMIPESPMPGWAAVLMAPLYGIFLLVVFALIVQSYGNMWLVLGLFCLMASPLVYLWKSRDMLRPHRPDEVSTVVGRTRRIAMFLNVAAMFFLTIFMLDAEVFGFSAVVKFYLSILGNVVLLTVVGADFLLALLRHGHEQSKALVESNMEKDLEARFAQLAGVGFTALSTLGAGPAAQDGSPKPPAPPPHGQERPKGQGGAKGKGERRAP